MPDNHGQPVKELPATDGSSRRVLIVQRTDGLYAVRPERWASFDPLASAPSRWIKIGWHSGLYATTEIAEREAYAEYAWVRPLTAK